MSDDYKTKFLKILEKQSSFLVLARGNDNLESLQKVCTETTGLGYMTIRYSYKFAQTKNFDSLRHTLIFALIKDLQDSKDIELGTLQTKRGTLTTNRRISDRDLLKLRSPELESAEIVNKFLELLKKENCLPELKSLVIFAEIGKFSLDSTARKKWEKELQEYKPPERLGIVLSGLPEKFKVPSNIPEIDLPPWIKDSSIKFKPGSASSDRPTDEDYLGFQPYAEGLAGLVLHSRTRPPLTIGIHGRWGQGKSSFMEMIDRSLVEQVYRLRYEKNKRQWFLKTKQIVIFTFLLLLHIKLYRLELILLSHYPLPQLILLSHYPLLLTKPQFGLREFYYDLQARMMLSDHAKFTLMKNQGFQLLFRKLPRPLKWEKAKNIEQEKLELDLVRNQENVNLSDYEKEWQEEKIKNDRKKKWWQKVKQSICQDLITINFNAWQYEDAKQIWAGLANVITNHIEKDSLSCKQRFSLRIFYAWKKRRIEFVFNILLPIGIFLVLLIWFGSLLYFRNQSIELSSEGTKLEQIEKANSEEPTNQAGDKTQNDKLNENEELNKLISSLNQLLPFIPPIVVAIVIAWHYSSRSLEVIQPLSERVLSYMKLPTYREQMGYQHQVINDLHIIHEYLTNNLKRNCKIIVFIDDLDRCSEENIIELLQAIHLILAESKFFIFLGIDTEMIKRAIRSCYLKNNLENPLLKKNNSENPLPKNFPESYLKKIIQLSFNLPESESDQRYQLIQSLFSNESQQHLRKRETYLKKKEIDLINLNLVSRPEPYQTSKQIKEVEDTTDELKAFEDYKKFIPDNPREMKRLVNIHRLIKIMLRDKISSWLPDKQRKIVKWLIFCTKWSNLVDQTLKIADEKPTNQNQCILKQLKESEEKKDLSNFINLNPEDSLFPEDIQEFELATKITRMVQE